MLSDENVIFMDFFAVKVDGSDVIAGISLYENLFTHLVRQDILQFFSGESKDYKYLKSP